MRTFINIALALAEAAVWSVATALRLAVIALHLVRAIRARRGAFVLCPRKHLVRTEGEVYACVGCGWTYADASIWRCENPECGATTIHISCPECRLSIRNPWRLP